MRRVFHVLAAAALPFCLATGAANAETVTIGTVNNKDMIVMQKLSAKFAEEHPDITLDWVVLEENVLRQRLTTDIATGSGQFDVATIGTYEVPIWAEQGWLTALEDLPADYEIDDVLQSVRDGLSYEGTLYALPFYAESSMTYYRKDLFDEAGLSMPEKPTWEQVKEFAAELHDPDNGFYGICLRGKPGWGENMALLTTMVNAYGGRWFDEEWKPEVDSPEWNEAVSMYIELLSQYGPPGASSNGFNENLQLFSSGKCGMWVDATVAAGLVFNPQESDVADKVGFAQAPTGPGSSAGSQWLWSWSLAIPESTDAPEAAKTFILWATSKPYIELVGESEGWTSVPPGTRQSTYSNTKYTEAAPFAELVLKAIEAADPSKPTSKPVPYTGVQYVGISEFQSIGTQVGQTVAAALTGQMSVDQALQSAQAAVSRAVRQSGRGS